MKLQLPRALVLCLLLAGPLHAQETPEHVIFDIELQQDARLQGGKSAFLEGQTNPFGQQFQVAGTELQQPIAVGLYTRDPNHPLRLRIAKGSLDEPVREVETDANGRIDLKFRTYDGFKLWVTADEPSDYQLVVWVGNELPVQPPRAVIPASKYEAAIASGESGPGAAATLRSGAFGLSRLEMFLGVGLVLVLVMAGFFFMSRRRTVRGTP